jgi:hypothetical protein
VLPARRSELVSYGLCAAALVVGTYVLAIDRHKPSTAEQASRLGMLVRVWQPDDITRVTIDRRTPQGNEHIELVREGDRWKLTSPRVADASHLAVLPLLESIRGARSERAVGQATPSEKAQFGLDAPRVRVEVAMKGTVIKLAVGNPATSGGGPTASDAGGQSAYLELSPYGDDPGGVFVVSPDLVGALDRSADAYREPSLVAQEKSTNFRHVEIHSAAGGEVVLDKAPYGTWRLAKGVPTAPIRVDVDVFNGFAQSLADLKADPFVPDDTPVDTSKGGTLDIRQKDGMPEVHVAWGGPCPVDPKLIVVQMRAPAKATGCVPKLVIDGLERPTAQWVDGSAFGLLFGTENAKISEIEAIAIEEGGKKLVDGDRAGEGMHLRAPSEGEADRESTERLLRAMAQAKGEPIVVAADALAKHGLAPAAGRITLRRRVDAMTSGEETADGGGSADWTQIVEVSAPMDDPDAKPTEKGAGTGTGTGTGTNGKDAPKDAKDAKDAPKVVFVRRLDDGAVLRIPASEATALGAASARLVRSPFLADVAADAVEHVTVTVTSEAPGVVPFELSKEGSLWKLLAPKDVGTDASLAAELTRQLATMTCERWVAEKDDGTYGFAKPTATIVVKSGGAKPGELAFELGAKAPEGGIYARVRGRDPICTLNDAKRDAILSVPFDRAAVAVDPADAPKIVATVDKTTRAMRYTDAKVWREDPAPGTNGTPGGDLVARTLADLVIGLRAEGLAHVGPAGKDEGFDAPTLVIEARGLDGKTRRKVTIGAPSRVGRTRVYWARVDGIDATFTVLREDVDRIVTSM